MNSFYYCTRKAVSWGTFRLGCEIHYENNHLILCSRKSCSTCQRVCKWTLGYGSLSKRLHLGFFYNRQPNRIHLSQGYCFWYEYQWESEAAIAPLILVQRVFLVLIIHPGNPRSTIDSTLTTLMSAASFFFSVSSYYQENSILLPFLRMSHIIKVRIHTYSSEVHRFLSWINETINH